MKCIFCESEQLFTVNSRSTMTNQVWRRRKCESCNKIFTTKESVDLSALKVYKKDGRVKRFDNKKIFCGIYNSLREVKNMDRGKAAEIAQKLSLEVEKRLWNVNKKIETREISKIVLETLLANHPNAFLAYMAYVNRMKTSDQAKNFSNEYWKKMIKEATG